jgi:ABC-type multidrug transport system fused ATPase/permease subunit
MNQNPSKSENEINGLYEGKSDHEVILILETQVQDLLNNLDKSQRQNSSLLKTQGQISVVRLVFIGVLLLVGGMVLMSIISWWSPKGTIGIEKELAFFERLLLVMLGILSSAVVALYDQRGNNGKED